MSNKYLSRAWPLQRPPVQKALLIALADYADENGLAWPGMAALETRTCYKRRALQRAIGASEKVGDITIGTRKGGHHQETTVYRLNLPPLAKAEAAEEEERIVWHDGRTSDADRVPQSQPASDNRERRPTVTDEGLTCAQTITEPPKESTTESIPPATLRVAARESPEFLAFWAAYPRKDARSGAKGAVGAWNAAVNRASPAEIMAGLVRYPFSEDPKFRPLASTWLNQDRWRVERDTAPPTVAINHAEGRRAAFLNYLLPMQDRFDGPTIDGTAADDDIGLFQSEDVAA